MIKRIIDTLDFPILCFAITAIIASGFVGVRLSRNGFDASTFVTAGDQFCTPGEVPPGLSVLAGSYGFDGQFYYRLAVDPVTSSIREHGITFDIPALRHQRIFYPTLVWMASLGDARAVPWLMIILNILGLSALGYAAAVYAKHWNAHAPYGLAAALAPGLLLTLSRDTVEIFECLWVVAFFLFVRLGRGVLATIALSFAVLTKETSFLIVLAAIPVLLFSFDDRSRLKWHSIAVPAAIFLTFQTLLYFTWGQVPVLSSGQFNMGLPFVAPLNALTEALLNEPLQLRRSISLLLLIGSVAAVAWRIAFLRRLGLEAMSWALLTLLMLTLSANIWVEEWTFMRVSSLLYVIGMLILIEWRSIAAHIAMVCGMATWLVYSYLILKGMF